MVHFSNSLLCLALLSIGCSDNGTPLDPGVALISGSWVLQWSEGGIGPLISLPPAGTISVDTFSPYGSFTRTINGTIVLTARYSVRTPDSGFWYNSHFLLEYSDVKSASDYRVGDLIRQWIVVERDTLRLADYAYDGFVHTYARLR